MTSIEHLLTIRDVCQRTGFSQTYIYGLMKKGAFPERRRIGPKSARWVASEVDQWVSDRIKGIPVPSSKPERKAA